MAITASQLTSTQTLEEFRLEFNKLQSDVTILKDNPTFASNLVFEGSTADAYETTLNVVDPTADRTVNLPDEDGTLLLSGGASFFVGDGGTIGSASASTAMTVASTGIVTFVDDIIIKDGGTIGTSTTPAAITIASGGNITTSGTVTDSGSQLIGLGKAVAVALLF